MICGKVLKTFCIGITLICMLNACTSRDPEAQTTIGQQAQVEFRYTIDSITLKLPVGSGLYLCDYCGGKFYVLDYRFSVLSVFDTSGSFVGRYLGLGKGPTELPGQPLKFMVGHCGFVAVSDFAIYRFSRLGGRVTKASLVFDEHPNYDLLMANPKGDMPGIYEVDWSMAENRIACIDSLVVLPIVTYHPKLNGYMHKTYYTETHPIALFDFKTGKLVKFIGKRPDIYTKKRFIPNFDMVYFWASDSLINLSFAADSGIYEYSIGNQLIRLYGVAEPNLNQDYPIYQGNWEEADRNSIRESQTYSSYREIKGYAPDKVLVRRVYRGLDSAGILQVYFNYQLVGRIEVNNRFRLIGVDGKYMVGYLQPGDEQLESNTLTFVRIRYRIIQSGT